ncbi:hypothetical protein [Streptomyces phaeochromogenes]|uniref:hypothetical protein n=1 Tax=Streptomyces phaeochromogenes TaxID=1923 RepID=UPI003F4CD161
MNHEIGDPGQHITELYWAVAVPALTGVLDQVRAALADLVGELRATMPSGDDGLSTPEQIGQALNVAVQGNRSRVVVTNAQASGENSSSHHQHQRVVKNSVLTVVAATRTPDATALRWGLKAGEVLGIRPAPT